MTTPEDVERAKRESVRGDVVTVRWVCYRMRRLSDGVASVCYRGFEATATRADFNAREARARCPSCGGLLIQRADGCEVVSGRCDSVQAK